MRLRDKVIIVTGSTTGIGKAIAVRCANEGASVVVHGLEEDLGNQVLSEIGSDKAVLHIEDLASDSVAENLVNLAVRTFGKLDAIVNNAAWVVTSNVDSTDLAFFRKVLDINTLLPRRLPYAQSAWPSPWHPPSCAPACPEYLTGSGRQQ